MKPIFLWEIRHRRNYIIGWSIAMAVLMILLLSIYPSIHDQAGKLNSVLNSLPAAVRNLKTGGSAVDISTPIGYLNSQVYYATLPLFFIVMSIGLGGSLLARDEENHTLELLLARPVSRGRILGAKAFAGIVCVELVALVSMAVILIMAPLVNMHISAAHLCLTTLYSFLFSLSFGAIAYALTAVGTGTHRIAVAVATLLSFGSYIMATLGNLSHYLQTPAKFFPYHYYSPDQLLLGRVTLGLNIYLISCFLICIFAAWLGFRSRDIY
jgi:ABC-2 type transport system permease protein